jgi:hypothetical protein
MSGATLHAMRDDAIMAGAVTANVYVCKPGG